MLAQIKNKYKQIVQNLSIPQILIISILIAGIIFAGNHYYIQSQQPESIATQEDEYIAQLSDCDKTTCKVTIINKIPAEIEAKTHNQKHTIEPNGNIEFRAEKTESVLLTGQGDKYFFMHRISVNAIDKGPSLPLQIATGLAGGLSMFSILYFERKRQIKLSHENPSE